MNPVPLKEKVEAELRVYNHKIEDLKWSLEKELAEFYRYVDDTKQGGTKKSVFEVTTFLPGKIKHIEQMQEKLSQLESTKRQFEHLLKGA